MEIGKRIKEERKKRKLTLQALADKIGTTKSYMWELENTETPNPTLRILVGLSKELNVSIDYLAKDQNQQGSGSTDGRAIRNSDAMKLERADENRGLGQLPSCCQTQPASLVGFVYKEMELCAQYL